MAIGWRKKLIDTARQQLTKVPLGGSTSIPRTQLVELLQCIIADGVVMRNQTALVALLDAEINSLQATIVQRDRMIKVVEGALRDNQPVKEDNYEEVTVAGDSEHRLPSPGDDGSPQHRTEDPAIATGDPVRNAGEVKPTLKPYLGGIMRQVFLNSAEEMKWLRDVHKVPSEFRAAILYSNEDSPTKLELYHKQHPVTRDVPVVWTADEAGNLKPVAPQSCGAT